MHEVHKDNKDRVETENQRVRSIRHECLIEIDHILERENLNARVVFYPGYEHGSLSRLTKDSK